MKTLCRLQRLAIALAAGWIGLAPAHAQSTFTDDFERPDGPVDGWTVSQGTWAIAGGKLSAVATVIEHDVFAGSPPILLTGDLRAELEIGFEDPVPADGVGRHGGVFLFASTPTARTIATGYSIDWIDRVDDHGFRVMRYDPGFETALVLGTPEIAEPPSPWLIEVEGDVIRLTAGGDLMFEVVDGTYREGHIGAWAFANGTRMAVDSAEITYTPVTLKACFAPDRLEGTAPAEILFDAGCTFSTEGVASWAWDFGDGSTGTGETAAHTFEFGGSYMVTLTVTDTVGEVATAEATIEIFETATSFDDDFERSDGPVDGWTVHSGAWNIQSGQLTTQSSGGENWAWAGDPAFNFPANFELTFELEFRTRPADAVGRHGGIMFCTTRPTHRYDPQISGYTIDWIDRVEDHGFRLLRIDRGVQRVLQVNPAEADPPVNWRVVVEGQSIRFYGDDVEYFSFTDGTYRRGFFGLWCWSNGQDVALDNVSVTSPSVSPCFELTPGAIAAVGTELTFDASCSSATGTPITKWSWDFGDGTTASGQVVTHAYSTVGERTARLDVETQGGLQGTTERLVEAYIPVSSFQERFDDDGSPPPGWTLLSGNWTGLDGVLTIATDLVGPEAFLFAGDPPIRFGGIEAIEFAVDFLTEAPADPAAPGRHGGVFFFGQSVARRFEGNNGYGLDWIDRAEDHGYRLTVFRGGVQDALYLRVDDPSPGLVWRIEIDGDILRLVVDGVPKGEFVDATWRDGYLALWAYPTGAVLSFDDLVISPAGGPGLPEFHRGDANGDGTINITDGIYILNYLFLGGPTPACLESANPNDDAAINITDGIYVLNYLFLGGPVPASPGPPESPCGPDPAGSPTSLGCASYPRC